MFFPTTSRRLLTTRMVISMCCCILHLRLVLASSGRVSASSSAPCHSVGRLARSFITSSDLRFQAPFGLLEFQCRNTMMTGMWDSFSPLHLRWLGVHLTRGPRRQPMLCVTCPLRRVILLVLTIRSPLLRHWCVFSVLCVTLFISLKTLQRCSGKVTSLSLAIPGCKLYVREI